MKCFKIQVPLILLLIGCLLDEVVWGKTASTHEPGIRHLLESQHLLLGTVEEIKGQEVRVNTGNLMSRYLSFKQAGDSHQVTPRVGDVLLLIVNDQNNVIEYHLYGKKIGRFWFTGSC